MYPSDVKCRLSSMTSCISSALDLSVYGPMPVLITHASCNQASCTSLGQSPSCWRKKQTYCRLTEFVMIHHSYVLRNRWQEQFVEHKNDLVLFCGLDLHAKYALYDRLHSLYVSSLEALECDVPQNKRTIKNLINCSPTHLLKWHLTTFKEAGPFLQQSEQ